MVIKKDIENRQDIEYFLKSFYEKVIKDETIGIIFTEVVPMNWAHHIPLITDFWETILFDNPLYKKNAMEVHYALNKTYPLQEKHFHAWLRIFDETIDEMYEGEKVLLAKKRARSIAMLMQHKMNDPQNNIPPL